MIRLLITFIAAFFVGLALTPLIICFARRLKVRQTVLGYVDNHAAKSGTPTMGGIAFTVAAVAVAAAGFKGSSTLAVMLVALTLGFGVIGFLDDFIKVHYRQNKGLSPWQKIIFQLLVAGIFAYFVSASPFVGDKLYLPFTLDEVSLGGFSIPFYAFVFIALVNAVNLTDGLDGLAGKTSIAYTLAIAALIFVALFRLGYGGEGREEQYNLLVFALSLVGALTAFLLFNSFPAKIFMGDTGALALGGALAGLAIMSKFALFAPIMGVMFVVSCVSDVIQVLHYKRTGRRIFLMAPFHHHLERKGWHENRIVALYTAITAVAGAAAVAITLALS